MVRELFHDLPGDVVQFIWAFGFRCFIAALPTKRDRSDHYSLFALIERWMDTTHIFHTRVGEFIISPMSLYAIDGITFGGTLVFFDFRYCLLSEGVRGQYVHDLLGFFPTWKNRKNIVLSSLVESFRRLPTTTPRQITQKARCLLLILLGTTLLCETGHEVSIVLLSPLRDLDRVAIFDWGSAIDLILSAEVLSRCVASGISCMYASLSLLTFFISYIISLY